MGLQTATAIAFVLALQHAARLRPTAQRSTCPTLLAQQCAAPQADSSVNMSHAAPFHWIPMALTSEQGSLPSAASKREPTAIRQLPDVLKSLFSERGPGVNSVRVHVRTGERDYISIIIGSPKARKLRPRFAFGCRSSLFLRLF